MRRILGILIAIVLLGALPGSIAAARPEPRVTIIVGPSGDLTDLYRSVGADAAREARRWTSDVVSVVSPNATWPVVKRALRGASIVVYLGHGNGFPSPYRDRLYPPTQDGLGLNPVAGGDDTAHQYFGEAFLAREIRLAPGAVVLLHHLCYASGNSEPGLPEGSLSVGSTARRQLRRGLAASRRRRGHRRHLRCSGAVPAWPPRRGSRQSIGCGATPHRGTITSSPSRAPGRRATRRPWTRPGSSPGSTDRSSGGPG